MPTIKQHNSRLSVDSWGKSMKPEQRGSISSNHWKPERGLKCTDHHQPWWHLLILIYRQLTLSPDWNQQYSGGKVAINTYATQSWDKRLIRVGRYQFFKSIRHEYNIYRYLAFFISISILGRHHPRLPVMLSPKLLNHSLWSLNIEQNKQLWQQCFNFNLLYFLQLSATTYTQTEN